MTKPNKIAQLAAQTTAADLSAPEETTLPTELFPPLDTQPARKPTDPAPQLPMAGQSQKRPTDPAPQRPMLTQPTYEGAKKHGFSPVDPNPDAPELDDTITAMLGLVGLRCKWVINYWMVYDQGASRSMHQTTGPAGRWQTGVRFEAPYEEWMHEINKFWKDVHPGEALPFGGILPVK